MITRWLRGLAGKRHHRRGRLPQRLSLGHRRGL